MVMEILSYLAILLFGVCIGTWIFIAIEEKQRREEQKRIESLKEAKQIAKAILNQLNKGE